MSVAPSYQKYEIDGYPFEKNKRWYVNIITPKGLKTVRWYITEDDLRINAKQAFGFGPEKYINLIIGKREDILKWKDTLPLYTIFDNTIFGWYMPSINHVDNIPSTITMRRLDWEEIRDKNDKKDIYMMRPNDARKYIQSIR